MVSSEAARDGPGGAIGMAWDAEIAAKPNPIASADAAGIFMHSPFPPEKSAPGRAHLTSNGDANAGGASDGANPSDGDDSPTDARASPSGGASALLPA